MKYSLFTVSVPEMTLEEAAKKMQEYGYDGVDWRVTDIPDRFFRDPGNLRCPGWSLGNPIFFPCQIRKITF